MSSQSFADLGVSNAVATALERGGISEPFPIQRLVISDVLAGRDVLAKSPTGSGKTLAFVVPLADRIEATDRRPSALVLAPTRELVSQIVDEWRPIAHARALKIAAVYGGVGIAKQIRQAAAAHIVVATPGRLEDLLERRAVSLEHVRFLVLDEADRMLDMGFRPAVDRIVGRCPGKRQTLFFSATLGGRSGPHRSPIHARRGPPRARSPGAAQGRHRASLRGGQLVQPSGHAGPRSCARNAAWHSSSCAPSGEQTGWSSGWARMACPP